VSYEVRYLDGERELEDVNVMDMELIARPGRNAVEDARN
jgi:hypothetical protein